MATVGVATFALLKRLGKTTRWRETALQPGAATRWNPRVRSASAGLAVAGRNWRSPGMRILGIRRVDARTRGPVGLRGALVGAVIDTLLGQLGRELQRPRLDQWEASRLAANEEIERLRESRPDADPEELVRDSLEIRRRHDVGLDAMLRRMLAHEVALRLPALWSPHRQTLTQRLAGTVIVDDR